MSPYTHFYMNMVGCAGAQGVSTSIRMKRTQRWRQQNAYKHLQITGKTERISMEAHTYIYGGHDYIREYLR